MALNGFRSMAAGVLGLVVFLAARPATPQGTPRARDPQDEQRYSADLEKRNPQLAEEFRRATALMDAGRLAEASEKFNAILTEVPDHPSTLRRLAYSELGAGAPDAALTHARKALRLERSSENLSTVAEILLEGKDGAGLTEAKSLAHQAYSKKREDRTALLYAQACLRTQDRDCFRTALTALRELVPGTMVVHYFGAIEDILEDRLDDADRDLERAVALGLDAQEAQRIRDQAGITSHKRHWALAKLAGLVFAGWLGGLALIFLCGLALSRATLRAIRLHAGQPQELAQNTGRLRKVYSWAIGIAAAYYYLSIPIVIAVVGGACGGLIWGIIAIGYIPVKLIAILGIVGLVSVWAMLKSIFHRSETDSSQDRVLTEAEAPGLWKMLRDVAARVGTRPVDRVILSPGTELAVTERGKLAARLRDRGERLLVLGVGVLRGMTQSQLRAVLGHEYGHFSHRDTARGDVAMTVLNGLFTSARTMAVSGGAGPLNPAWQFLRIFHALFLRITHGASRLQEVMADQFAALAFGARSFCDGLRHVVRRSIEFDRESQMVLRQAEAGRMAIANLYAEVPAEGAEQKTLEQAVKDSIERAASPYDSHPPPQQRMDWVMRLAGTPENDGPDPEAWELFADRAALEGEMTRNLNRALTAAGLIDAQQPSPPLAQSG